MHAISLRNWRHASRARGATLIEVLIATAISGVGLLGLAGLMTISAKADHAAYESTQAGLAAQMLIESMHVNPAAVATGGYDGSFVALDDSPSDCGAQGCNAVARAAYDRRRFASMLAASLPDASASLGCNTSAAHAATCRLQIDWTQLPFASEGGALQSLVWVFVP